MIAMAVSLNGLMSMSSYIQPDPDWLTYGDDMYFAECPDDCIECHPENEEDDDDLEEDCE